jgi:hypothetical protein
MKTAKDLTAEEKDRLIDKLQEFAFGDVEPEGPVWNPDALENNQMLAEAGETLVEALTEAGLAPDAKTFRRPFVKVVITVTAVSEGDALEFEDLADLARMQRAKECFLEVTDRVETALTPAEAANLLYEMKLDPRVLELDI